MYLHLRKRYKHFHRYREIANVLTKHGFGYMLNQLGLAEFLRFSRRRPVEEKESSPASRAQRIRLVMEELGPTFIKLGQLLSTRSDLLAPEYINELSRLQEQVPPFSFQEVSERVQMELGTGLQYLFPYFEKEPMAAASIGQVHRAVLNNGEKVVVKVQRPGIKNKMEVDIEILYDLAGLVDKHTNRNYRLVEVVEEFDRMVHRELDFTNEGKSAETFDKNFASEHYIMIPGVHWEYTTSKIITMQRLEGIRLSDTESLSNYNINEKVIAQRLTDSMLKQIFIHGIFHADPHPGNIAVLPGDKIILMDFGIVGVLDDDDRDKITNLVLAIINRNTSGVIRAITALGVVPGNVDFEALRRDIDRMRQKYLEVPLKEVSVSQSLGEVMQTSFKHNIRIRTDFTMLVKALITLEGLTSKLDPDLSIVEASKPLSKKVFAERFSPQGMRKTLSKNFYEYYVMLNRLPGQLNYIMDLLSSGELTLKSENPSLHIITRQLHKATNRLSFSIVTAGFFITAALLAGKNITFLTIPVEHISLTAGIFSGILFAISIIRPG